MQSCNLELDDMNIVLYKRFFFTYFLSYKLLL